MPQPNVSVIIPVYKAESFIEKCCRTLFSQSLEEMEYIFIDDSSPDNSIPVMNRVLQDFPLRKSQVKVIRHKTNEGVSKSRQDGVNAATGKYIIHCDPDDWVKENMYEILFEEATEQNADIVICDISLVSKDFVYTCSSQAPKQLNSISILESISGHKKPLLHGSTCNKLVKADLYKQATFPNDISFCEDVYIWFQIFRSPLKISYLNLSLYYYRQSNNSIIHNISESALEKDLNLINYLNELKDNTNDKTYKKTCESMITNILMRFFHHSNFSSRKFKQLFFKYRRDLISNKRIGIVKKIFLAFSIIGYYTQSRFIYRKISKLLPR